MSADQPKESALRDDQVRDALEGALTVLELIAANRKGELMSNVETRLGTFVNVIDTILACRAALAATRPAEPAEQAATWATFDEWAKAQGVDAGPTLEQYREVWQEARRKTSSGQARSASTLPPAARETVAYEHDLGTTRQLSYSNDKAGSFETRELVYKIESEVAALRPTAPQSEPIYAAARMARDVLACLERKDEVAIERVYVAVSVLDAALRPSAAPEPAHIGDDSLDLRAWYEANKGRADIDPIMLDQISQDLARSAAAPAIEPAAESATEFAKIAQIIREVMAEAPFTKYQYVAQNAQVEAERASLYAGLIARLVGRRVAFLRPSAALAAPPDSSVHPAGLAPAPSSTVRAKGGA